MIIYVAAEPTMGDREVSRELTAFGIYKLGAVYFIRDKADWDDKFIKGEEYEWIEIGKADPWVKLQICTANNLNKPSITHQAVSKFVDELREASAVLRHVAQDSNRLSKPPG